MPQDTHKESRPRQMSRAQMKSVLNHVRAYQRRLLALLVFPLIGGGYSSMPVVITFFSPEHRCAVITTYYGLSLNVANLGGNVRLNFLFSSSVQLVSVALSWVLVGRLGRKRTHCAFMLLSGTSCLATIFPVMFGGAELHWVTSTLVMLGNIGVSAAFSVVYLMYFTIEVRCAPSFSSADNVPLFHQHQEHSAQPDTMPEKTDKESRDRQMSRAQMKSRLNQFGLYQRRLLMLLVFPVAGCGYVSMAVVITFFSPEHRCRVPGLANDTFAIQNDAHRMAVNLSIPVTSSDGDVKYSKCEVYQEPDEPWTNGTLYDVTEPCDSWVYDDTDFERTVVTQFDLVCEDKGFRANVNMMFILGLLAGSPITGVLCDRYGRKKVFMLGIVLNIVLIVATTFPVLTSLLLVYRFLCGFAVIMFYLALYVLSLEFMGPSRRAWSGSLINMYYVLGPVMVGGLSYVIRDWRWLQILTLVPFVVCLSYWWLLDESPRWLMAKGRLQEAQKIILKIMKVNKMTLPTDTPIVDADIRGHTEKGHNDIVADAHPDNIHETDDERKPWSTTETEEEDRKEEDQEIPHESPLKLFKYPNLIARTAIIFFNWCAVSTTYYGLSLNVANLGGNVRLNFLFSSSVQLVSVALSWVLVGRLGRKRTHCAFMLLSGTSCLATIFPVMFGGAELHWVTITLVMLGKMGISAAFSVVYLMSGELFPTVIRNLGLGCSSTVARVATALSPYIADLTLYIEGKVGLALPLVIFGALALMAGLLGLCLPETLHRKLPDTIVEAANFTKQKSNYPVHVQHVTADGNHPPLTATHGTAH